MLHIKFTSRPFDKMLAPCAVITTFSDIRPLQGNAALLDWRLNGRISQLIQAKRFNGELKENLLMPSEGRVKSPEVLIMGLGKQNKFGETSVSQFINYLLNTMGGMKIKHFMISFSDIISDRFEWRNSVRLLVSKLHDFPMIESINLCETDECVRDAKRRHMDFGMNVEVSFETVSA